MKSLTIKEASKNLEQYIEEVKNGEIIFIGRYGKPEVQLLVSPKSV